MKAVRSSILAALFVWPAVVWPAVVCAQGPDNVLLVINDASAASVQIGEFYARKRSIPQDHIVHLKTVTTDAIDRPDYSKSIEGPVADWLGKNRLQDRVLYIVLTKGVPLRVAGTEGRDGTVSSVDSELTLLYRRMVGTAITIRGRLPNPYYLGDRAISEARPFTRFGSDIYLVTRLDGFTTDDVLKLIERGAAPVREGKIVLDQKATLLDRGGDQWLAQAADRLEQAGAAGRVVLEASKAIAATPEPVIGYYSWGSNDPAAQLRRFGLKFVNGAIGGMYVSTDGRTFAEPPAKWVPSDPEGRGPRFGGSFQSLAGDLIRDGITGVSAHVAEPFLDATVRPQILFPAYVSGLNLAEAFYLAVPFLSWQTVIVGDPLCTPFARTTLAPEQIHKGIDQATELPTIFAERRLALMNAQGLNQDALKLVLKADGQLQRDATTNIEPMLVRAADLEPRLGAVHLRLAQLYTERNEIDKAIDRYRRLIGLEPQNHIALNNLAYALAVQKNSAAEALPLAERAYRLAPSGVVADTLGWVHHLLGNDRQALPLVEAAATAEPNIAEVRFHAAVVYASLKSLTRARAELDAAVKLDPKFADRADVKALREMLK
jgi:uncharacterized protein (TIGR03790 family)